MEMRQRWWLVLVGCCVFMGMAWGEIFVDDFNTPHNYVEDGTDGTIWDDYFGYYSDETVEELNASIDREGQLFISSEDSYWSDNDTPKGPFLYKVVEGDFIASVKVTDYAGTEDEWLYNNDGGLMARAFLDDAGDGEDWISIDYFPIWWCGNFLWQCDDGVRDEAYGCNNGKEWDLDPWLQLERQGNTFYVRTSSDGVTWTEMSCSPKIRNDFDGLPLMVGLRHATYNTELGYVAFDHFSLETIEHPIGYNPEPSDGSTNVIFSQLSWEPGDDAAQHDVYLGKSFEDVNSAGLDAEGIYQGRQDANSFVPAEDLDPGETYYWRVDEVNEAHSDQLWKGDVWSFTPVSKKAWDPMPQDDATCVLTDATLSWQKGYGALLHTVYFGTDADAVAQATSDNPMDVYQGLQGLTTFEPDELDAGVTYYWRVDETERVSGTTVVHTGDVWTFTVLEEIPIADTTLVGWWKLDGEAINNDIVVDYSGYGRHGTAYGEPTYGLGYDRDAMDMDGRDDYVELPIGEVIASLEDATLMTWADFSGSGGSWQRIFDFGNDPNIRMALSPREYYIDPMNFLISTEGEDDQVKLSYEEALPTGWHHVAVMIDAEEQTIQMYVDGALITPLDNDDETEMDTDLLPSDLGVTANNWLGRSQYELDAYYLGSMDDFRIYNRVLTEEELTRAMAGDPYLAWNANPVRYSTVDVESGGSLSWSSGQDADQHDLYFGSDFNDVNDATPDDTTGIYRGILEESTFALSDELLPLQTYYWRVDEHSAVDDSVIKGMVWEFSTAAYLVVDSMESYGEQAVPGQSDARIWYSWLDGYGWETPSETLGNGTGSVVDLVTSPVYAGEQALQLKYDNNGNYRDLFGNTSDPTTSELIRTFDPPQDWTRKGMGHLVLHFYGDTANSLDPLYVSLTDSSDTEMGSVTYSTDPNGLIQEQWNTWVIELSEFSDGDMTQVQSLTVGVGNPNGPEGGTGTLYIDEIRLYP